MSKYYYPEERIAVVAMGGLFPDANNTDVLWNNILKKKVSIKEVPDRVFNKEVFYRPEVRGKISKGDKSYTKVAAIPDVDQYPALSRKYKIPPAVAEHMDPNQHAAIYCVDQALGMLKSTLPRERTAVILGTGAPGKKYDDIIRRTFYARIENQLRNNPLLASNPAHLEEILNGISKEELSDTLPITEDSSPGMLQNITSARIANIFDFWGPSYTVDAACASSLSAVALSAAGLLNHEFDAAISGGVEVTLHESGFVSFSAINALSPDGSYPFDPRANGFVMGLGGGILVLKRLSDALRDGDRIISIISGYGQGSDGRGKYIAAPSEEGQIRVIQSACKMAGYHVDTVEMIEAHGTGTIVGDVVEVSALKRAFQSLGASRQNYCGIGSVKSNIGHLRYASGAPGLIKASMSLHNKILPPSANIKEINPKLQLEGSPFYILTDEKAWKETKEHPRRANVSSYGFGGADYHICLEEFRPEFLKKNYTRFGDGKFKSNISVPESTGTVEEVVLFSGESLEDVRKAYGKFMETCSESLGFEKAVYSNNSSVSSNKEWRVAICANSVEQLKDKWGIIEQFAREGKLHDLHVLNLKGIFIGVGQAATPDKMAWMFPGQASQYPNMLKDIYENYPSVKSFYMQADSIWEAKYGYSVMPFIFGEDEEKLKKELKNTKNTHPAMFFSNIALFRLLSESGVRADYMIGHSLGEITALYASGMLDLKSAVSLVGARGFSLDSIPEAQRGAMVSVKLDKAKIAQLIEENGFKVSIANINSTDQTVVGGEHKDIDKLTGFLSQNKITYKVLEVSHAFHTGLTAGAAEKFYKEISETRLSMPKNNVMACHLVDFYPDSKEGLQRIPAMLKEQITSPVNFVDSVMKLYEKGVRVFVEAGPSSILTNLVKGILADKDVKIIAANHKNKGSIDAVNQALAELFACGVDISMVPSVQALGLPENVNANVKVTDAITQTNDSKPVETSCSRQPKEPIVYSGVSMGLPGTFKKAFSDDNFKLLLEGKNLIEMLTDDELKSVLDLNITRLIKTEGTTEFKKISSINEVIQLAGKFGKLDMLNDYMVDEKLIKQMTLTVCAGVAAGYEALKDAGIPLVREYIKTASGASLPGRLVLPREMQADTGIIYANGLFTLDSIIGDVSRYVASKFGGKTRIDLISFYESVISKVSDSDTKKLLSDWFTLHYSRLMDNSAEESIYEFNHHFMNLLSSQANNRLAQFIGAEGPNLYVGAACSSTASAVTIAEDMIRGGHAKRMIVIGADISSVKTVLPWVGAGFLSMGTLTDSPNVFEAAVPFDNRRNGMILGSGAVGLVMEKEEDVAKRGMNGICRILGTHAFNTAGHQSKIESSKYCIELDRFLTKMEEEHRLDRNTLASKTVYCSHETYSPKKGGCSHTEKMALESAFGEKYKHLKVINTKGMTGHTLGASIEEAVAAKVLQYQQIPPVVNYREPDPELAGLDLSKGGAYGFEYVLRMVAAFGGNGNYHLLQKIAQGDERIVDKKAYGEWLERITSSANAVLKNYGRILAAEGDGTKAAATDHIIGLISEKAGAAGNQVSRTETGGNPIEITSKDCENEVLQIISEITKYPVDMLDKDMEMEADLGIDTVKQATIFSILSDKYNMGHEKTKNISQYSTIGAIIDLVQSNSVKLDVDKEPMREDKTSHISSEQKAINEKPNAEVNNADRQVLDLISEITKYPVEMLERDMELEADLGIDTIKQATIFSMLSEKYNMSQDKTGNISQYSTIGAIIDLVQSNSVKLDVDKEPMREDKTSHISSEQKVINEKPNVEVNNADGQVLELISEITKYPVEMLERDMELEADLGIDTIKQATIFSVIGDKFGVNRDESVNISQFKTIGAVIDMVEGAVKGMSKDLPQQSVEVESMDNTPANQVTEDSEENPSGTELCLQIPVFVEESIGAKDFDLKQKSIWVIGDNSETVKSAAGHLKKISDNVEEFIFENSVDAAQLEAAVSGIVNKPVDVIVDCTHLGESIEFGKLSRNQEQNMLFLNGEARFIFYKKLSEIIPQPKLRIVCAVSMDGCHGLSNSRENNIDPFYGALCGFYKGLRKEWEKSNVKIVDIGGLDNGGISFETVSKLADELEELSYAYEIGYYDGKRVVVKMDYFDRANLESVNIPDCAHFVVTGGGFGITAEIILGLSKKLKGKFTILGRTGLPENIEELSRLDENGLEHKKTEIHKALKQSGKRATPVEVQGEYEKIIKAVSIYKMINEIKRNGSDVLYLGCDVRDYENLKAALNKAVEKNGPVNILIHSAGIEKSKLLGQKTREEFNEVFSVKADGLCNLYRLADKKELRLIIGFSSISGRFGNEAQLDYCAANNFISSFMAAVRAENKGIRALSIAWSGWKDTGMAWRNEFVKEHSEEMGIHLIEPERGTDEFIRILTGLMNAGENINASEMVISKGLTHFIGSRMVYNSLNDTPLIDWVSKKDGKIQKVFKVLSVKRDPIINHHRIGSTPLMPAVGFMEMCAQFHSLLFGRKDQYCFKNIKLSNPLKLFHEKAQEVVMEPRLIMEPDNFEAVFYNVFQPKYGKSRLVELNSMQISGNVGDYRPLYELKSIEKEDMAEGLVKNAFDSIREKIQNTIQLGPVFADEKCKENNRYRYNEKGIVFSVLLSEEQITNKKYQLEKLLINPAFTDSLMQACGIHSGLMYDRVYLPWQIGEFGVIKTAREPGSFKVYARVKSQNDELKTYDVILFNEHGEVCYYAKDVIVRRTSL